MTEKKEVFDIDHEVCEPLVIWVGVKEVKSRMCLFETQPWGCHAVRTASNGRLCRASSVAS